jgi:hypothetical protein
MVECVIFFHVMVYVGVLLSFITIFCARTVLLLLDPLDPQLLAVARNAFDFGKIPFLVAQRTHTAGFQPALDTIQMKHVATIAKSNRQSIIVRVRGIGLVFNRWFVQGIATNGALCR